MDTFQVLSIASLVLLAIATIASLSWAFYLDGKIKNRPSPKQYSVHVEGTKIFNEQDLALARDEARAGFQKAVSESSGLLRTTLANTVTKLGSKAEEMGTMTLSQEFEKYQTSLGALREETIKEFGALQKELDIKRTQLISEMESEFKKGQADRIDAFNDRIADVVSSYLLEALDKGIDLGVQSKYIVHTLEANKENIKKDVLS